MEQRIIKFRGKRIDNGEWVYGDLITTPIHHDCVILENGCINHAVDRKTVGQCTGLPSKSGEYIYEGDILKTFWQHDGSTNYDYELKGKVVWNEEKLQFSLEVYKGEDVWIYPLCSFEREEYFNVEPEVIGNVFEHSYELI